MLPVSVLGIPTGDTQNTRDLGTRVLKTRGYQNHCDTSCGKMKVIPNNCVSEIRIPVSVETASGVDYNPVLGLYATFNYDDGVSVWNPLSGKVVAEFEDLGEDFRDTLFVPGNCLAISSCEGNHGGIIEICTVGEDKSDSTEFVIDSENIPVTYPGAIALSPGGNLLVTDAFNSDGVYEIFMDWHDLKVLKSREIIPVHEEADSGIELLSCSRDFEVATYVPPIGSTSILSSAKVCFNSEEEVQIQGQEKITYYVLGGEEKQIEDDSNGQWSMAGLVHDGHNLIIANGDEIVLLESATEGSTAHLIASGVKPSGQIRINHEGQLMVCEEKVIKLFEYKNELRSLQSLCRRHIRETIRTVCAEKVNNLVIPSTLKDYLLYKSI